jgi:UDPglucose 6-dehydrogenase
MNVLIIGAGYVGLSMGVVLAKSHDVTLVDIDESKVAMINRKESPIYERDMDDLLADAVSRNKIRAITPAEPIGSQNLVLICVGTPSMEDGSVDLSYVDKATDMVLERIEEILDDYCVIGIKSTVPPGTTRKFVLEKIAKMGYIDRLGVVFNPEFLREGSAIADATNPDRIIIGASDYKASQVLRKMYQDVLGDAASNIITISLESAELCKYVNNAFLATKISFANEIANITERISGADIDEVMTAVGEDSRISPKFFGAGAGYGGSCFPKDVAGLVNFAEKNLGITTHILRAIQLVNSERPARVVNLLLGELPSVKGKKVSVLGLAFKPGTDDTRESPALKIIDLLHKHGAEVWAHDPLVREMNLGHLAEKVQLTENLEECLNDSIACILVTEWDEYTQRGLVGLTKLMQGNILIDGRRVFTDTEIPEGFSYRAIGQS